MFSFETMFISTGADDNYVAGSTGADDNYVDVPQTVSFDNIWLRRMLLIMLILQTSKGNISKYSTHRNASAI